MSKALQVSLGVGAASFADVVAVARHNAPVALADDGLKAVDRAWAGVDGLASSSIPAYGISTGFGALATRRIQTEKHAQLQRSLVRSHAAGPGPEIEREVVRAPMLRLSTLTTGHTGVATLAGPRARTRLTRRPARHQGGLGSAQHPESRSMCLT